jgi:riboflavin kinase/FMN adenylyltransferase
MNIGVRPTIHGHSRVIEVHLFDFNLDIYGKTIRVHLHAFLRPEQKFDGLDALKAQLDDDKKRALALLEKYPF